MTLTGRPAASAGRGSFQTRDGRRGEVRVARSGDARACVAIIRDAASLRPRAIATTEDEVWTPRQWRRALIGWSREGATLVAEVDGLVAGVLGVARSRRGAGRHVAELGLAVGEPHRGIGVGGALMRAVESWAREFAVTRLELRVFPENERARHLYRVMGYAEEGVEVRGARFPEGDRDLMRMAKILI